MPGSSRWLSSNFGHASGYRWAAASRRPSLKSIVAVTGSLAWAAVAENAPATAIETASPRNIGRVMRVRIGRVADLRPSNRSMSLLDGEPPALPVGRARCFDATPRDGFELGDASGPAGAVGTRSTAGKVGSLSGSTGGGADAFPALADAPAAAEGCTPLLPNIAMTKVVAKNSPPQASKTLRLRDTGSAPVGTPPSSVALTVTVPSVGGAGRKPAEAGAGEDGVAGDSVLRTIGAEVLVLTARGRITRDTRSADSRAEAVPNGASASVSSATSAYRALGSFSRHFPITRSRPSGASGRSCRNGGGGSWRMAATRSG